MKDRDDDYCAVFAHLVYPEACDPLTLDDALKDVDKFIKQRIRGDNQYNGGPAVEGGTIWGVSETGIKRIEHCMLLQLGWQTDTSILREWNRYSGGNGIAMYLSREEAINVRSTILDLVRGL